MNTMPRYSHHQIATLLLAALGVVASSPSATGDAAVACSFPALDDLSTDGLVVRTTSSSLSPATFLFDAQLFPEFNRTKGFVLLSQPVQLWGNAGEVTRREASFNTSFTVRGVAIPVSFVVLLDSFPPLESPASATNSSSALAGTDGVLNASDSLAFVEVGAVGSYGPESPDVGLNVTVTPNGTAASRTVWIQYNAVTHHICVYVAAAAGKPRPLNKALLDAPLHLASRRTAQSAFVGFFASTVRDVIHCVRDWELTVDRFPGTDGDGENGSVSISSWLLILVVVLGSVAVTICVASVVVCYSLSRRRQELRMEHIMNQAYPHPTRNGIGFLGT